MKLIVAFTRPEKLAAVQAALDRCDVSLLMVSEALDYRDTHAQMYRGLELQQPAVKVRLEVAVSDSLLGPALAALVEALDCLGEQGPTHHGRSRIFVTDLVEAMPAPLPKTWLARSSVPRPTFFSRRFEHVS